ncbi:MAG: DedA family protein [Proteobacteria bacterium]|nr:DedA family protein [Pseudomonadota bacterium]
MVHGSATLVSQNPELAVLVAFLAAIIEAVAVLGILLPGTPILMAVAGAAAIEGLPMMPIMVVAIVGAVIGDFLSFWLGHRFNGRLRRMWPFSRRPELMVEAEKFFHRYGVLSVAICRFLPVLRSTVPLVAGMVGMKRSRFLVANVLSAFVWAPVHVLPAQWAGMSITRLEAGEWQPAAFWLAAFLVMSAGGWLLHRRFRPRAQVR